MSVNLKAHYGVLNARSFAVNLVMLIISHIVPLFLFYVRNAREVLKIIKLIFVKVVNSTYVVPVTRGFTIKERELNILGI